ncbi:hypothetical protein MASR1M68_12960 [Elusimicrobiota bacterium]
MRILALIDDMFICEGLRQIINNKIGDKVKIDYRFSYNLPHKETEFYKPINIKEKADIVAQEYGLIFSLCSQIFPEKIVKSVRCINFHFGILPYVCGVLPITFSIVNNIPLGITVHLMDEKIDNGDIIYQEEVEDNGYDTAKEIEKKCQAKLIEILDKNINDLIYEKYKTKKAVGKRVYYSLNDFKKLCNIDLNKQKTAGEIINMLRALQFNDNGKAYFVSKSGDIINMSIGLKKRSRE